MTTTRLKPLRRQISHLRAQRQQARWLTGYAAVFLAVAWVLAAIFLLDWLFEMGRIERVLAIAVGVGAIAWAIGRFTLPWLGQSESDLDVALLVEKKQGIDSDLVAAMQFESPEAAQWGSPQLESAVIEYVADFGRGWNLLEGFDRQQMVRRMALVLVTVVLVGLALVVFPKHSRVFLSRLMMSSEHYPTKTQIQQVVVNGQPVELRPAGQVTAFCPYGEPLRFQVVCAGDLPEDGVIELQSAASGLKTTVELKPLSKGGRFTALGHVAEGERVYEGELPRLVDTLHCQLYLGDAWTDPARLEVLPLPTIESRLTVTPPPYAKQQMLEEQRENSRQLAVIEGSRVDIEIECSNKELSKAEIEIDEVKYPLAPSAESSSVWRLDSTDTPLEYVDQPIAYRLLVVDEHGMQPQRPIAGYIRIRADRPPQVHSSVVTRYVLPEGRPSIAYRVADDFGIDKLVMHVQIASSGSQAAEERTVEIRAADSEPIKASGLPLIDSAALDLSQFGVSKGDQIKVTLEATDYRGDQPGRATMGEPLVLNVTDESGLLSILSEADERSVRQIDAIIQRQLGIGGKK